MLYQVGIAVGGMIVLVLLFVIGHQLAERRRALDPDCKMNSLRCLGCLASGRCRQEGAPATPGRRNSTR